MPEIRRTTCNRDCPDACGILATVENGRVTKLEGDPEHPVTRGFLCYRTNQFLRTQYSPERLTTPLLRHGRDFVPIGWDGALDFAARGLERIRAESGPAAIFHYRSGGSLGLLKELSSYFFERFGPTTVKRGDICSGAGEAAQSLDFGESDSNDLFDLENARHIVLWGKNVVTSSPHLVPVLDAARARGARIVLVDPVHHRTAGRCDRFIQPRPGGDFALAMAVARILFAREWVDPKLRSYADGVEAFERLSRSQSVETWCAEADVATEAALHLAECLGPGRPCAILVGWGLGRRANGGAVVRALDALGTVTGNVGIPGGGVSFYFKRRAAFDTSFSKGVDVAPRTIAEPLFGPGILAATDPPVRAVWVTAGNPVAMLPESETTVRALSQCDLVVVVDSFLTDTARLAHLVLPTTTLLEADDLLGSYGHHYLAVARPVVPPPAGVRSDLEIIQGLAERVGLGPELAGSAREWKERILRPRLAPHAVGIDDLERGAVRNPCAPRVVFEGQRFPTANGRANLVGEAPPPLSPLTPERPLRLMALSTPKAQSSHWAILHPDLPELRVHPAAAAGRATGAVCRVESALGSMRVRLRLDPEQRRDVALLPKGGHHSRGASANALLPARITDLGDGGALYDEPVGIRDEPAAAEGGAPHHATR